MAPRKKGKEVQPVKQKRIIDFSKPAMKYLPEYAQQAYEHLSNGYTISSFNVYPPVRQKTIFAWQKDHEDFALAIEMGRAEFLRRLEMAANIKTFGLKMTDEQKKVMGKIDGEMLRFRLARQYRHEYSEKTEMDLTHKGEVKVSKINIKVMPGRVKGQRTDGN